MILMHQFWLAVSALSIALMGAFTTLAAAAPADEANAVVDAWVARYSANDRDGVVALYAPDAILLGTTSPVISEGTEQIRTYFDELPGSGRSNRITDRRTRVLSPDAVLSTGFYAFARAAEGNVPRPSRFSMLLVRRDGRWLILHHHSSPHSAVRR
jgi:uncharacterized protein (TIGR02246 family)